MLNMRLPLMIAAGLAVTASLWWREHARRSVLSRRWRERSEVEPGTFLKGVAAEASTSEVEHFRRIVAETFGLDPRRLRSIDHLRLDLEGDRLSRQRQLFFVARLEREFSSVLPPSDACFDSTAGTLFETLIAHRSTDA